MTSVGSDIQLVPFRYIPRIPRNRLRRERLHQRLDMLTPLTFVSALRGTGKTVLLAEWARRKRHSGARVFWVPGAVASADSVRDMIFPMGGAAEPTIVVIDDADESEDPHLVSTLMSLVLSEEHLHVVVAAREELDTSDVPTYLYQTIRGHELFLTDSEVRYLGRHLRASPDSVVVASRLIGGWFAPLHDALTGGVFESGLDRSGLDEVVEHALAAAIPASELDAVRANVRAGGPVSALDIEVQHRLARFGLLFAEATTERAPSYLPVVAEVLGAESRDAGGTALERQLSKSRVHFVPTANRTQLRALRAAGRWPELARHFAAGFMDLGLPLVAELFETVPPDVLSDHPILRVAHYLAVRDIKESDWGAFSVPFIRLPGASTARTPEERVAGLAAAIGEAIHDADYRRAAERAERLLALLRDGTCRLRPRTLVHVQYAAGAALLYRADPTVARGLEQLETAFEAAVAARSAEQASMIASRIAVVFAFLGDMAGTRRWAERAGVASSESVAVGIARSQILLEEGHIDRAHEAVSAVSTKAQEDPELWAFGQWAHARVNVAQGRASSAVASLISARQVHGQHLRSSRLHDALVNRALADSYLQAGFIRQAAVTADRYDTPLIVAVPKARIAMFSGRYEEAASLAASFLWRDELLPRDRVELTVIRAAALRALGDDAGADAARELASELADRTGCLHALNGGSAAHVRRASGEAKKGAAASGSSPSPRNRTTGDRVRLTARERIVVQCLASGGSNQEIAKRLGVSVNTVKKQLASAYTKLEVTTREDAVYRAEELGLLRGL